MGLKVIGVGLGRTGTHSLKLALELLLGGPCFHMAELVEHKDRMLSLWVSAYFNADPDWDLMFDGYVATVDWPAVALWRPLCEAYPDVPVLLSSRASDDVWWKSARDTIFSRGWSGEEYQPEYRDLLTLMWGANGIVPDDEVVSKAAYEQHLDDVRAAIAPGRLIEWQTGDGWEPLCRGLGLPVPAQEFPHVNSTEQYRARWT
jgi:Sulfotransferase domain